ncbi:hypothetical protein J2X63_001746 [Agromyces sp. 3263]|nr:hypothetical protein [Agromyces sp. 3263]
MTDKGSLVDALHEATHRLPGVSGHEDRPAGHQGTTHHSRLAQASSARRHPSVGRRNHASVRRPRVLVAWQRRIAAFFGEEV